MGFAALMLATACSDDHFEVKQWAGSDKSLWENIEAKAELSDFASILKRTKVMKDENDKSATLLASDYINQPQSFTVWAPINGSFNAQAWHTKLDEAEALRKEGTPQAKLLAQGKEWQVWNQLVANHLARFNHAAMPDGSQIELLNSKRGKISATSFNGVALAEGQLNASNGALHLLKGLSPFSHNIYDYIFSTPTTSELATYLGNPLVAKEDTAWSSMTPGTVNEHGKMVYIDTLFNRYNLLLNNSGAKVRNEDSTYVAFIPSNTAWNQALGKMKKILNYGSSYNYSWAGSAFQQTGSSAYKLSDKVPGQTYTLGDSLQRYNMRSALIESMFFAPYAIENGTAMDSAALINYVTHADSLRSTNGIIFYNPAAKAGTPNAALNPVLQGIKPYRASNGYVFELQNYDFDPAYSFLRRVQNDLATAPQFHVATTNNMSSQYGQVITLSEYNYNKYRQQTDEKGEPVLDAESKPIYIGVKGEVKDGKYVRFENNTQNREATIDLRLPAVYSAAYTIKLVVVPAQINTDFVPLETTDHQKLRFRAQVIYDDNSTGDRVEIDERKGGFDPTMVNTIQLWDKFEFKKCYMGLPADKYSFPRLRLTLLPQSPSNNCKELNIVSVIIEPYRGQ